MSTTAGSFADDSWCRATIPWRRTSSRRIGHAARARSHGSLDISPTAEASDAFDHSLCECEEECTATVVTLLSKGSRRLRSNPVPWPITYTDWGTGNGWCMSDLDELIGSTSDANACWTMCKNTHGSDLVAIDWTPDGECYCQDDCQCMEAIDDGDIHLITSSAVAALPNACVSACPAEETAAFENCLSWQG